MISRFVAFACRQRTLVILVSLVLFVAGYFAFRSLPIDAYPDVADTEVQVITQWPGHAAEEMEQQVTIPIEGVLNGVPRVTYLRSISLFGLSVVTLIFDDGTDDYFARAQVLEKL